MQLDQLSELQKQRATKPTTMAGLISRLQQLGEQWRVDHTESNEKTGKTKVPRVSPRAVADILEKECHFTNIGDANKQQLFIYDMAEGLYMKDKQLINRLILSVERNLNMRQCRDVYFYLETDSKRSNLSDRKELIIVNNGVFNKNTKELEPFTPDHVFISKISTNYNPNAKEPTMQGWRFSKWVTELSDGQRDKETLIWQMIASAVNANYSPETAFFLIDDGRGHTGKGTLQQILINLVGEQNCASLKLKEFDERFKLATIFGKALVIGDDNDPNSYVDSVANFKSVTTGDVVSVESKGVDALSIRMTPTIIQSMNGAPKFKDITGGFKRRLRAIKMLHQYDTGNVNRDIKDKYIYDKRVLEYILFKALQIDLDTIIETTESNQTIYEIALDNDSILDFFESEIVELSSTRLPITYLFNLFRCWCDINNSPTKIKQRTFTTRLIPIMEKAGWQYNKKDLKPLEGFHSIDLDKLKRMDKDGRYMVTINEHDRQGLFLKE